MTDIYINWLHWERAGSVILVIRDNALQPWKPDEVSAIISLLYLVIQKWITDLFAGRVNREEERTERVLAVLIAIYYLPTTTLISLMFVIQCSTKAVSLFRQMKGAKKKLLIQQMQQICQGRFKLPSAEAIATSPHQTLTSSHIFYLLSVNHTKLLQG